MSGDMISINVILVVVLIVAVILLLIYAIPLLIQLRRSLQKVERLADTLEDDLPGILKNVHKVSSDISQITDTGRRQAEAIGDAVGKVTGVVDKFAALPVKKSKKKDGSSSHGLRTATAAVRAIIAFIRTYSGSSTRK